MYLQDKYLNALGITAKEYIDIADIHKAYKKLCFVWHPDRFPENMRDRAEDKIKEINEAYDWLKNNFENTSPKEPVTTTPKKEDSSETYHFEKDNITSSINFGGVKYFV